MIVRVLSVFYCFLAFFSLVTPATGVVTAAVVPAAPSIGAESFMLMDYHSGRVLASSNIDKKMEPASLTKMMTTYVVFSELKQGNIALTDMVHVSEKAWRVGGSKMFIEVDTEVSVNDLLKGLIIQSGNDSSVALAEFIAGDETSFADLMNQYSIQLGLSGTNFENASGLPSEQHYTNAQDMAILAAALIRDFPDLYKMHAEKEFQYNGISQYNRNRLLWRDESVDGLKTGYTKSAGYCLVASAVRDGMRLISVVLGSDSERTRVSETSALLSYGYRFFETHRLYDARQQLTEIRIWKGQAESLGMGLKEDLYVTVPRGQYEKLNARMEVDNNITAPVLEGETRGKLLVTLAGEQIVQRPLVTLNSVPEGNLWRQVTDHVRLLFR